MIAPSSTSPLASAVTLATVLPSSATTAASIPAAAVAVPAGTPSQHLSQQAASVTSVVAPTGPAGPAPGFSSVQAATSAQLQPQSQAPRQEQQQQQNFAAAVQQLNGMRLLTSFFILAFVVIFSGAPFDEFF